jgi:Meiotically up-regulated gene 113
MHTEQFRFSDGGVWGTASDFVDISSPVVIVPTDQIVGLTDTEIGQKVQCLINEARRCAAKCQADWVTAYGTDVRNCSHHLDDLVAVKPLLMEFAEGSDDIQAALQFMAEVESYVQRRELRKIKVRERKAGLVYLISGGGYYKIGLTTDLVARHRQIGAKLPFQTEVTHTIKTSNVEGLEQYWHERFAAKRVEGEWFVLSLEDIAEFCEIAEMEPPEKGACAAHTQGAN